MRSRGLCLPCRSGPPSGWLRATSGLLSRRSASTRPSSPPPAATLRTAIAEVASLGVPTGAQFGFEVLAFVTFTAILGTLPAEQIAAHQLALAMVRTSFLPGLAVGEAASVLVGQALGRHSLEEAERVTRQAMRIAVGFMAACGLLFAGCRAA